MDPVMEEIFRTVLPSAPYVVAAYALLWVALLVYIIIIAVGTRNATRQLELLEEELRLRDGDVEESL